MTEYIDVRGIKIGEGIPKICVPVIGRTRDDILEAANSIKALKHDLVEWRVDFFEENTNPFAVNEIISRLRSILEDAPILFTFRTKAEGGEMELSKEDYLQLNLNAINSGLIDLVDVELFTGDDLINKVIEAAHENNTKVVISNHDFERTPAKKELLSRMQRMQSLGGDILKIAVMPESKADVITLLSATEEMYTNYAHKPIVTMSMAKTGVLSRICGEFFGSAITFGAAATASAPGQIPSNELYEILQLMHKY